MSLPSIDTGRSRSCLTSGGSTKRSTASDKMKNEINNRKSPLMNPAKISARTYPKLYLSFDLHLVITDATNPARRPMSNINKSLGASFNERLLNSPNIVLCCFDIVLNYLCSQKTCEKSPI